MWPYNQLPLPLTAPVLILTLPISCMSPLTQQSRVLKPFGLHVKLEAVGPLFFPSSRCDTNGHVVQLDAKLSSFAWLELKQVDCIMQTLVFDNCKLVVVPVERKIQTSCRKLWDVLLGADEHFRRRWQLDSATSNGMDRVKLDFYPPFFTNLLHELVTLPSWKDAGVIMGYNANGEACVLNLEITEVSALYNILLIPLFLPSLSLTLTLSPSHPLPAHPLTLSPSHPLTLSPSPGSTSHPLTSHLSPLTSHLSPLVNLTSSLAPHLLST